MIGIENREQRDCESLIMVNTSQYFWLGNSSISTRQMIHSHLINHFIQDYYCHQSCFFFHLHLTVTDVIIIYTVAVWGISVFDREGRGQGERRSSPGFGRTQHLSQGHFRPAAQTLSDTWIVHPEIRPQAYSAQCHNCDSTREVASSVFTHAVSHSQLGLTGDVDFLKI